MGTISIELSTELEQRLRHEAEELGQPVGDYARALLEKASAGEAPADSRPSRTKGSPPDPALSEPFAEAVLRQLRDRVRTTRGGVPEELVIAAATRVLAELAVAAPAESSPEDRRARVHAIAGKYAGAPFTVDDFLREKIDEAQREAQRDERRWPDIGS